jgi:hypothetical protein
VAHQDRGCALRIENVGHGLGVGRGIDFFERRAIAAAREHERRLLGGFRALRAELDAFAPDLVLIWGDDQYENFRNDCVPAFCAYIFDEIECRPYGGGRRPFQTAESSYGLPPETARRVRGHREAASALCASYGPSEIQARTCSSVRLRPAARAPTRSR